MHATPVEYLRWIVLLPLLGAAINGLLNRRLPRPAVSAIAVGSVAGSFVLSVRAFLQLRALPEAERALHDQVFSWIAIGDLRVDAAFLADPLSAVMILLVTGVGLLIHIYSTGYMAHDDGFARFFTYLNLFVFAMLVLVLGDNLLLLFVGWEGVGLCSYLLIGFWYHDLANSAAGKKAFIVNRVGDFGFLLGMFLLVRTLAGHVDDNTVLAFSTLKEHASLLAPVATAAALLLFVGAAGKSAQIPLYVWLPDAMAGPTPVSALIHAATMVTAGVYMVARMSFLYEMSATAMAWVAGIGVATALFASTIALVQNDIKKVLAYSTVSQLGYMFLACGVGAYGVGIFHVLTHAFFKALLFLGAGSVIHAMADEQDMRKMGNLKAYMPWTFRTMAVATLAIAGIFPLAGFVSKDEILYYAFKHSKLLWGLGFLAAGLTAFYMARLMALTFFGTERMDEKTRSHLHEAPWSMTGPLLVLAVLAIVGGFMGWPAFLGGSNWLHHWLDPVVGAVTPHVADAGHAAAGHAADAAHAADATHGAGHGEEHNKALELGLAVVSVLWALLALGAGFTIYRRRPEIADRLRGIAGGFVHRLLAAKYWVDELYDLVIVHPIHWWSDKVLWRVVDAGVIDGLIVNGVARFLGITAQILHPIQNGSLRFYAYTFAAGVMGFLFFLVRKVG